MVREVRVAQGHERDFEEVFAPKGIWAELLGLSGEYLGTVIRAEEKDDRLYEIFDYFRSHKAFEGFREHYRQEYERFRQLIAREAMIESERILGSFYEDEPGAEGTDLVPM